MTTEGTKSDAELTNDAPPVEEGADREELISVFYGLGFVVLAAGCLITQLLTAH